MNEKDPQLVERTAQPTADTSDAQAIAESIGKKISKPIVDPGGPMHSLRISTEEWMAISRSLEKYHAVFYKVWEMGKPIFTNLVPTAAVQFNEIGDFVIFHFNPNFWLKLDTYTKRFVICHEALHVILNHGIRIKDAISRQACNAALDVVVNHSLLRDFGFDRVRIDQTMKPILYDMALADAGGDASKVDKDKIGLCWVDTVFRGKNPLPPDNEQFEYYYNLFERLTIQIAGFGGCGKGQDGDPGQGADGQGGTWYTLDDHEAMAGGDNFGKVIDRLNQELSNEEKNAIKGLIDRHGEKGNDTGGQLAGTGTGGQWHFVPTNKAPKKKKWETVIKKWSKRYMRPIDHDQEQWARLNRRMTMLPEKMFLPSDMEVEDEKQEKTRIKVYFFMDTSGSCWDLKDRFFKAVESLPDKRFDVRLLCFDTTVVETTLASRKIYGGGGTSFRILEEFVQRERNKEKGKYPEAVFVMTDGYGDKVVPERADKWYWFISSGKSGIKYTVDNHVPKECNFFNLEDFE